METLVVIGLLIMIVSLGMFIGFDFYRSYAFRSERNTVISILQKARSQSMNNVNQVRHGVHFCNTTCGNKLSYIIFQCPANNPQCTSYPGITDTDLTIEASYNASISNSLPHDVMFDQLSGTTTTDNITGSDGKNSYSIQINTEGRIEW
jgi:hypothetical protein